MLYKKMLIGMVISFISVQAAFATGDLSSKLNLLAHYQANFQQVTTAEGQMAAKASGHIWMQRPWHMRWQVEKPNKQTLIVNGKKMIQINPDLEQATVRDMNATELSNAGLLLSSHADLTKAFTIKALQENNGIASYQLTPKKPLQLTKIILQFNRQGLVAMDTWNTLGQKNVFTFSHVNTKAIIDKNLFIFKPSKGMDVLRAGQ